MNTVLARSLRPKTLDEVVGQDVIVNNLRKQFKSGRIPHFFLISGSPGTGKTTLSRIIAMMLQNAKPDESISKYDIREINAADENGVDTIRDLIKTTKYMPLAPSLVKVIILDEAQQLTTQAQNTLLKVTEDPHEQLYFIFCTSNSSKIIAALKRRAYPLNMKGIDQEAMKKLLQVAKTRTKSDVDMTPLINELIKYDIDSPGLILQAVEKYLTGSEPHECIFSTQETTMDTHTLCKFVSKGDWKSSAEILKNMKKEDIIPVRNYILMYFKTVLLNADPAKALATAKAIRHFDTSCDDLTGFLALLCLGCTEMRVKKTE